MFVNIFYILISDYLAVHVHQVPETQFQLDFWFGRINHEYLHQQSLCSLIPIFSSAGFFNWLMAFSERSIKIWSPLPLIMKFARYICQSWKMKLKSHMQHFKHVRTQQKTERKMSYWMSHSNTVNVTFKCITHARSYRHTNFTILLKSKANTHVY